MQLETQESSGDLASMCSPFRALDFKFPSLTFSIKSFCLIYVFQEESSRKQTLMRQDVISLSSFPSST